MVDEYTEKLKALRQYRESQRPSADKTTYLKEKKELEQEEYAGSQLGKVGQNVINIKSGVSKGFLSADKLLKKSPKLKVTGMVNPMPVYSKSQMMIQELFGSVQHFGTGQNLPVVSGNLMPNNFGRDEDGTAMSFGLGRRKTRTGGFFGI